MSVIVAQKTVDIAVTLEGKKAAGRVIAAAETPPEGTHALRLHFSLLGETGPALSPLPAGYTFADRAPVYRYDWTLGITPLETRGGWWNWLGALRDERAIAVQLLVDCDDSGCSFSEIAAHLLCLQPSKDTATWLEKNSKLVGENLKELAAIAGPVINTHVANVLTVSALMSNFVGSGEQGAKNWFLYRFLDERKKCCAIEWNIHRKVVEQYGPLLRGSIVLAFHGTWKQSKSLTLTLRPRLGFGHISEIDYLPPVDELEQVQPVALEIKPQQADASAVPA